MKRLLLLLMAFLLAFTGWALGQTTAFPDVPVAHWAAGAVQFLKDHGIVLGFPDGQFHGGRTITRYEEAAALERALKKVQQWIAQVPAGPPGPPGPAGSDGKTIRSGPGAPAVSLGVDGDFYIDRTAWAVYGPKTSGAWGSPTSLVGPAGPAGPGAQTGTIQGTAIGLPNLVVLRFAQGSASQVPITWGTCLTFYACREPFEVFKNGSVADEMRVGLFQPYARIRFDLLTAGAGGNYVAEYYNGSSWVGLSGLNDGTQNLTRSGWVAFTVPSTWPKASIESSEPLHWIRLRATAAWSTKPVVRLLGVPVVSASLRFKGAAVWDTTTNAVGDYGPSPTLPVGAYVVDFDATGWRSIQYLVPIVAGPSTWVIGPQGR